MGEIKLVIPQKDVHQASVRVLSVKIGRDFDSTEQMAIGFLVERRWGAGQTTEGFIQGLGLEPQDQGNVAADKVRTAVYDESISEIERRTADDVNNPKELAKLQALREFINSGKNFAEQARRNNPNIPIHVGGVPEYWLPEWVKS